jgi:hypothetical protein
MTAGHSALPEQEPVVLGATMIVHDDPPDGNRFGSQHCRNIVNEPCYKRNTTGCVGGKSNAADGSTVDWA